MNAIDPLIGPKRTNHIAIMKSIAVFTRSYPGDKAFLPYLYKSLEKYFPSHSEVVLVVERRHLEEMLPLVPQYVKVYVEDTFAAGTIQHKFTKLTADQYTSSEYIMHVDSDCIFTRHVEESMMFSKGNRPYLEFASYAHLHDYENSPEFIRTMKAYFEANVLPTEMLKSQISEGKSPEDARLWVAERLQFWIQDHFEEWFEHAFANWKVQFGLCVWERGTSYAMGKPVLREYSRRVEKLYPRKVYDIARCQIEKVHGMTVREFIKTRIGKQDVSARPSDYFSDLNFIGAVLDDFLPQTIEWIDIEKTDIYHRPPFIKQYISYDSVVDGKLKPDIERELNMIVDG